MAEPTEGSFPTQQRPVISEALEPDITGLSGEMATAQELSYDFLKIKHGVAHKRLVTAGLSLVVPGKAAPT
ncbi:hypothetical protein H671_5g14821 [Cricetulus griseus]|uniref:Uncharacterized protein n=1 Tax=Cricetulus griseus TaxID=10029 RepID=A0A061I2P2_CRIGR|nr:hypothetical protein H671_5g14821 [Cricetulus griseus]